MNKAIAIEKGSELEELILTRAAKNFYRRTNAEKCDLFPFYCILVSSGTNKNTDHFDPVQLWRAKNSPVDKPVNIGHKQIRIIGHMLDSIVVGEDLKPIPEETKEEDLPNKLHLITSAVIYRVWEDPAVQAEVNQIIEKVSKGQTYVSMEALFRSFFYLLTNAKGEQKVIPRNEKTSSLTKYLRQYKGPGRIYDYTIARGLEDITFSAVGIVENPANTSSIISANLDLFSKNMTLATANDQVYINIEHSTNGENNMSKEDNDKDMDSLKCENESLKKDIAQLNTKIIAFEKAAKEASVADTDDDTEKEMATLKSTVASLREEITKSNTDKSELTKANETLNASLEVFKKATLHSERAEAMMKADTTLSIEKARELVKGFDELSEAGFKQMLTMFEGYASRTPKEVTPETILSTATAEKDAPLGTLTEDVVQKTVADITNFLKPKKTSVKE